MDGWDAMSSNFIISVYSSERYRLEGGGVVDALAARGYDAELVTGPNARDALRRTHPDDRTRLRVLLIGADLSNDKLAALHKGLDPAKRGDLLVVGEAIQPRLGEQFAHLPVVEGVEHLLEGVAVGVPADFVEQALPIA